jgi:sporulation protein YlmC with PRC-barrel domain
MGQSRTLNAAIELKGMSVLRSDTGERLGEVSDVIILPTEGRVAGIAIGSPDGWQRAMGSTDFIIGADAIMAVEGAQFDEQMLDGTLAEGLHPASDIIGSNVVTEDGKLLGRVSEIHVSKESPIVFYRIAESKLQRFLGGGFFIAGNLPRAYSPDGARLIVPQDTEEHYAASSLGELIHTKVQRANQRQ